MSGKRRAVCVLGMHRSGTSTVSRCLNLLGVDLGDSEQITGSGKANPKGFWEFTKITRTQQKILKCASSSWDTVTPLRSDSLNDEMIAKHMTKLNKVVRRNFRNSKLWGWKDPRTCLLVPIWEKLLHEFNTELSYVIVIRNPLDVAYSLAKRNSFPIEKSMKIWALYTLSAFLYTENKKRTVIHYDTLLEDWESVLQKVSKNLSIPWPEDHEELQKSITDFINPSFQHNKSTIEDLMEKTEELPVISKIYQLVLQAEQSSDYLHSNEFTDQMKELYFELYHEPFRYREVI